MIPFYFFLIFIGLSTLAAVVNWRWGLFLCVLVGLLQDPIRKITPNTPIMLTLAFGPIYAGMFFHLISNASLWKPIKRFYPQLIFPGVLFFLALAGSTVQTISYGPKATTLAVIGMMSYAAGFPALFLGYYLVRKDIRELEKPLIIYAGLVLAMSLGAFLESGGVRLPEPKLLGTVAMKENEKWYHTYGTLSVAMVSGFFRSPELLGWHAATLCVIAVYMMTRQPKHILWWGIALVVGVACVILCGRRKMIIIFLAFLGIFTVFAENRYRSRLIVSLLLASVIAIPMMFILVDEEHLILAGSIVSKHNDDRLTKNFWINPLYLLELVGVFGFGVGTKTQGTQHLDLAIDVPMLEGGIEKIMIELGLFGTFSVILLGITITHCLYLCLQRCKLTQMNPTTLGGLIGFLVGNCLCFIVSFQIFGDPFILFLLGIVVGVILSFSRLAEQRLREKGLSPDQLILRRMSKDSKRNSLLPLGK